MKTFVVLRSLAGISGDMLVTGFAKLLDLTQKQIDERIEKIGLAELKGSLRIEAAEVQNISGWRARVALKSSHTHRTFTDIQKIISASRLSARAKQTAEKTFWVLAEAEGKVHSIAPEKVAFHEIGGLDSILDICLASDLLDELSPDEFVCGPLPLCDGVIRCQHGLLLSPAPAVLNLLENVPVHGIPSQGETVTPTAIAFLKASGVQFGAWPAMTVRKTALVYGGRVLPGVPNGAIFVAGDGGK